MTVVVSFISLLANERSKFSKIIYFSKAMIGVKYGKLKKLLTSRNGRVIVVLGVSVGIRVS